MDVTRGQYMQQRHRQFGRANPQRMEMPFWEMMVRNGKGAYWAHEHFQDGEHDAPIWCFQRYGMSETKLSDGRTICIAGEHEDHYDPDFCIYNDVIVRRPDEQIEIYGYPEEVIPPTDFHSATLLGERIILIGSLGYRDERRLGYTQVFSLALSDLRMTRLETTGPMPGWLHGHAAEASTDGRIIIKGGLVTVDRGGRQSFWNNLEDFSLDVGFGRWQQITNRNWRQFHIRPEQYKYVRMRSLSSALNNVRPTTIAHTIEPGDEWNQAVLVIEQVPVALSMNGREIAIVVKGSLPEGLNLRMVEEIRSNAEAIFQSTCVLDHP